MIKIHLTKTTTLITKVPMSRFAIFTKIDETILNVVSFIEADDPLSACCLLDERHGGRLTKGVYRPKEYEYKDYQISMVVYLIPKDCLIFEDNRTRGDLKENELKMILNNQIAAEFVWVEDLSEEEKSDLRDLLELWKTDEFVAKYGGKEAGYGNRFIDFLIGDQTAKESNDGMFPIGKRQILKILNHDKFFAARDYLYKIGQ